MWLGLLKPTLVLQQKHSNTLDKLDFIKDKKLCASKDTNKKMKIQLRLGKNANYVSEGRLVYRI